MVIANQTKYVIQDGKLAKTKKSTRRREKNVLIGTLAEPDKEGTFKWPTSENSELNRRKKLFLDKTDEKTDFYSNIEVGTQFRHLHFGGRKLGDKIGGISPINFTHIVDLDSNDYHKIVVGRFLEAVLCSYLFRWTILGLVILNALIIGLNTFEKYSESWRQPFEIIDQVILSVFIFEILLKWMYDFRAFWVVSWNILDFVILAMIASASLLPTYIQSRTALAIIRVVRALRSLRSVSNLTSLIVVSHTIIKSSIDMANILLVLIIFMVVMAVAGVVLFDDPVYETTMFLNAMDAWFVLFICVTQDGWLEVLDSFRQIESLAFIMISLYLVVAVSIGAFVFANLIVAVIVANLESAIRVLKAEKMDNENPLLYHDEFSPDEIDIIPTYAPFRVASGPMLRQRPLIMPKITNASKRRLQAYLAGIVELEQNLLEYSLLEKDLVKIMSVFLAVMEQVENRRVEDKEKDAKTREEAIKDLRVYSHLVLPSDAFERAGLHQTFNEIKRGSSKTSLGTGSGFEN